MSGAPTERLRADRRRFWMVPTAIFTFLLVAVMGTAGAVRWNLHRLARATEGKPSTLPMLGRVPSFAMVDERGRTVESRSLAGAPWVVDFIFLSCTTSCPKLTERMAALSARLADKQLPVRLVSITVDPDNDDETALRAYAERWKADPTRWSFLRGKSADLEAVVVDGFKVQVGRVAEGASVGTIMHGDWFVLVDRDGRIRGYYAVTDPERFERLVGDAERLSKE